LRSRVPRRAVYARREAISRRIWLLPCACRRLFRSRYAQAVFFSDSRPLLRHAARSAMPRMSCLIRCRRVDDIKRYMQPNQLEFVSRLPLLPERHAQRQRCGSGGLRIARRRRRRRRRFCSAAFLQFQRRSPDAQRVALSRTLCSAACRQCRRMEYRRPSPVPGAPTTSMALLDMAPLPLSHIEKRAVERRHDPQRRETEICHV